MKAGWILALAGIGVVSLLIVAGCFKVSSRESRKEERRHEGR